MTMAHIKILWTALSIVLGASVNENPIRGLPCITKYNQLFCRSGGISYPLDKIERFIDDNKEFIKRIHGEFINFFLLESLLSKTRRRFVSDQLFEGDGAAKDGRSYLEDVEAEESFPFQNLSAPTRNENPYVNVIRRSKRHVESPGPLPKSKRNRVDACSSEEEVATPFWGTNSRGQILAIVNSKYFSQVIHYEKCTKKSTKRCSNDCGCEQKYKYHRLLAYDPDNDCKGIFMDWFLFPSCCSCRCDPL